MPDTLYAWSAKRSGATLTVTGETPAGLTRTVSGVLSISSGQARLRDGRTVTLINAAPPLSSEPEPLVA